MALFRRPFFHRSSLSKSNGTQAESPSAAFGEVPPDVLEAQIALQPGELSFSEASAGGLGRHLGLVSTTFLVVGRIIGTGIFSTPSSIAKGVGSVGAALLLWVLGLAISASGLCIWMELGCMFPRSGGEKVYLESVYKRPKLLATVVFSVQAVLLGFTASGCIVFASNMLLAADHIATEWEKRGIAILVIVVVTILHTFFPKIGVHGMNLFSLMKLVMLSFIVVTGWVALSGKINKVSDPGASFRNAFRGSTQAGSPYAIALFKVLNSFNGWSNASYVLNEVKQPVRALKIAAPLGLGACGLLYILANVAYYSAATSEEISASGVTVAAYFIFKVFGSVPQRVLSVFVALSALGNVMTVTFAMSRVNQELAKEGVLPWPKFWASTWPFGSPSGGLLLHFIPSFIVIAVVPFGDAYSFIIDLEGYPMAIVYAFVVAALIILRWKAPNLPRPFKVWWPVIGFFGLGQCFLLVVPLMRPPGDKEVTSLPYWLAPVVGIIIMVSGVVYWALWRKILPRWGRYRLVQGKETLRDGTVVTLYKPVKQP